jgi:hypothetical protein
MSKRQSTDENHPPCFTKQQGRTLTWVLPFAMDISRYNIDAKVRRACEAHGGQLPKHVQRETSYYTHTIHITCENILLIIVELYRIPTV